MAVELIACTDSDFDWMLGDGGGRPSLTLPPGGVDSPTVLRIVQRLQMKMAHPDGAGTWMIVRNNEVVGLCGYKTLPVDGSVEIGFSVSASRRRCGFAAEALSELLIIASHDSSIKELVARSEVGNIPSRRVLERNGFEEMGFEMDPVDGQIVTWRRTFPMTGG